MVKLINLITETNVCIMKELSHILTSDSHDTNGTRPFVRVAFVENEIGEMGGKNGAQCYS
jgi:hypothetical protein